MKIAGGPEIPEHEISFTFSRSAGPGGQNVNKVSTRVTLRFDVAASPSLSAAEKRLLRERLASRISRAGVMRVVSSRHRSQAKNRAAARERFAALLAEALRPEKPRRPTRPRPGARERRLAAKRRRSRIKEARGRVRGEE